MLHFIQVSSLSHSIALFLSLENKVGRSFKLVRMGEGSGGGGGVGRTYKQECLKSRGTLPKFSPADFFSANWVDKPNGEKTFQDRYKNDVKNGRTCCS